MTREERPVYSLDINLDLGRCAPFQISCMTVKKSLIQVSLGTSARLRFSS